MLTLVLALLAALLLARRFEGTIKIRGVFFGVTFLTLAGCASTHEPGNRAASMSEWKSTDEATTDRIFGPSDYAVVHPIQNGR